MKLPLISLNTQNLTRLDDLFQKEWLLTNGIGGYSSSTVLGVNTRKYHGLLVAALTPPGDRTVCLLKLDEDIIVGDKVFRLATNEFQSEFFPEGHIFLRQFSLAPFPKYVYENSEFVVEKTVFMPQLKNAVAVLYEVTNKTDGEIKGRIFPLLSCRHFHMVINYSENLIKLQRKHVGRSLEIIFENSRAALIVNASAGEFIEKPDWIQGLFYREEAKRGESNLDDYYQPGYFEFSVRSQKSRGFSIVTTADKEIEECRTIQESVGKNAFGVKRSLDFETRHRAELLMKFQDFHGEIPSCDWLSWILLAADSFIVRDRNEMRYVIAGYHWFEVWGRDTFISFPGLFLVTGRFFDAQQILLHFAKYIKNGLIPNFIPDKPENQPAYNTVDASLWYVNAILQYVKYTGDFRFVEENLWEKIKTIISIHEKGTSFGICVDSDGLLAHGPRLTWMDAENNGQAITPRAGKAVEVQALWYNALRTAQMLATTFGHNTLSGIWSDSAAKTRESFNRKFWNREKRCLFDVLEPSGGDPSLRPNQIVATALDFPILYSDKAEAVVDTVQHEFQTPVGLRTLARSDPRYHGVYEGNRMIRNEAYHNGTAWPWLLGPFTTAFLKVKGSEVEKRELAFTNFIQPLLSKEVFEAGLGTVNEIYDGDPPHTPRGCISQAWSIAEPLRAYIEDVLQTKPKFEKHVLQY